MVISSVSDYIFLEMALLSEHVQTDGFKSFWYSNSLYLMTAFTTGLSGFVQIQISLISKSSISAAYKT